VTLDDVRAFLMKLDPGTQVYGELVITWPGARLTITAPPPEERPKKKAKPKKKARHRPPGLGTRPGP
jgi:hypothetical protein